MKYRGWIESQNCFGSIRIWCSFRCLKSRMNNFFQWYSTDSSQNLQFFAGSPKSQISHLFASATVSAGIGSVNFPIMLIM